MVPPAKGFHESKMSRTLPPLVQIPTAQVDFLPLFNGCLEAESVVIQSPLMGFSDLGKKKATCYLFDHTSQRLSPCHLMAQVAINAYE